MKKTILICMSVFALTACNNSKKVVSNSDGKPAKAIGGDKDEHGCLVAAGESWSQLKQSCVQIFNIGQRLNPTITKEGEAIHSAFILFNDDKSKAELFLPNVKNTTILTTKNKEIYEGGTYKYEVKTSSLFINGNKSYTAKK